MLLSTGTTLGLESLVIGATGAAPTPPSVTTPTSSPEATPTSEGSGDSESDGEELPEGWEERLVSGMK